MLSIASAFIVLLGLLGHPLEQAVLAAIVLVAATVRGAPAQTQLATLIYRSGAPS